MGVFRNPRTDRLVLFVGALILLGVFWTVVWRGMDRSALARVPILDEAHYLQRAVEIRDQGYWPDTPFTMSPLYSYLVAVTGSGRLFDEHGVRVGAPPRGIRWLQALLWAGTAWLLLRVGRDLYGSCWGWVPPLLWVGYGPAAILAGQVLMEIPLTFAATLAVAVSAGQAGPDSRLGRALLAGAMVGVATLLRGTAIVLFLPVTLALIPEGSRNLRKNWRGWFGTGAPILLAGALVILPFVVMNSVRAHRPAPPALNGGVNLYIGNGPGARGFFNAFPGYDVENDPSGAAYLSNRLGRTIPDAVAADRAWAAEARSVIMNDPIRAIRLYAQKIRLHFVGVEIPQVSSPGAWRRHVPLLKGLVVPWAFLASAGLAGGILAWRRRPALRPWLMAAILLVGVQSLFFVVTRYRLILVPALSLAAVALAKEFMTRRGRDLLVAVVVVLAAVGVVWPWGLAGTVRGFEAEGLGNEAVRWEHLASAAAATDPAQADRDLAEAEELYTRSLALMYHEPGPWQGLARVVWFRGDRSRAAEILAEGYGKVRDSGVLSRDLTGMLMRLGREAEALPYLRAALESAPGDADLLHEMVIALAGAGQLDAAAAAARRLIEAHPDNARGYVDLGTVLGRQGKFQEAAAVFAAGLQMAPDHPELTQNLDRVQEMLDAGER